jgi:Domain of Unknown Function (DUF1080)
MKRSTFMVVAGLLAVLPFACGTIVRGQELSKGDATASEAVKVESKLAPITVSADVLKKMTMLFDGKSLDGWDYDPKAWSIVDGAMRGTGKGGNIWTKGDYGNFRLFVTSRVASPPGDDGHNHLGVLFWGDRPVAGKFGTNNAVQVQPPHGAMWDYHKGKGNIKVERDASFKKPRYQDWHVGEILANLDTGEVRFANDGVEVMHHKYPDVSALKRGPIGMQIHAAAGIFDYKDIYVEADPKERELLTVKVTHAE